MSTGRLALPSVKHSHASRSDVFSVMHNQCSWCSGLYISNNRCVPTQAAVAELQQQLDAEREHRQQLQQQLLGTSGAPQLQSPASEAACEEPAQAVAGSKASAQAGADKDMTLAIVSVHATDDIPKGEACNCVE